MPALRDENRTLALIVENVLGTSVVNLTGASLTNAHPLHVAIVDGNGDQISSFGGGTQYTNGGVPPANPVGPTLLWSDGANWQTVSTAKPLPVSASIDTTGLATSANQVTLNGYVDGIEALLTTIDADTSNISTKIDTLAGAVSGSEMQVDVVGAIPAGTNLVGKVSIDQVTANANEVVTKTGSVTNATLSAETTKVIGTVNISAGQSMAVTNAGTFATQIDGAALTSLQLIDDPVSTDDGSASIGRKIFMVGALADDTSPDSVDEGDGGMLRMSLRRELYTQIRDAAGNERGLNISADGSINTGHNITGIGHGVKTVTTAGTDLALATSTACKRVVIQAQTDNTGLIAVGASGVDATEATGTGIILYAGDSFELEIDNLADVYIDSTVSGDGVRYTYFT